METAPSPTGRVFLVTTGGSGLGRELALALLEHGHYVHIVEPNAVDYDEVHRSLVQTFHRYRWHVYCGETSNRVFLEIARARMLGAWGGKIDCLVNIASYVDGFWEESFRSNVMGPMLVARTLLPLLATAKGSIVNLLDISAEADNELRATARSGLLGLTLSQSETFATAKVRANALLNGRPGVTTVENLVLSVAGLAFTESVNRTQSYYSEGIPKMKRIQW